MELQEILNTLACIERKNQYTHIKYQSVNGDYRKETEMVVRFVDYSHIKGVVVAGKPNPNETHITDEIVYNSNTNQYYILINTTGCDNHKPSSKFYYQDNEIDRQTYEVANPPRKYNKPLVIFKKNIKDIISIG